jgi:hypothetical protein
VVSAGAIVIAIATDYPWRGGLVLLGIVVGMIAFMVEGLHRTNCVTLTPECLVVGTETFRRDQVDGLFGAQPPLVLDPDEQARVEEQWPLPPDADIRIAGGGWGRRPTMRMVVLREADTQQLVAVFSRHPRDLDRRLAAWLGELPDTPPAGTDEPGG